MKLTQYLTLVRAEIDSPEKWCKGALENNGRCCLLGAIHRVYQKYSNDKNKSDIVCGFDHKAEVKQFLLKSFDTLNLPCYNDHPEMTYSKLMVDLDRAILEAEKLGI